MSQDQRVAVFDRLIAWVLVGAAGAMIGLTPYLLPCVLAPEVNSGQISHGAFAHIIVAWALGLVACGAFGVFWTFRTYGLRAGRIVFRGLFLLLFVMLAVARSHLHVCTG